MGSTDTSFCLGPWCYSSLLSGKEKRLANTNLLSTYLPDLPLHHTCSHLAGVFTTTVSTNKNILVWFLGLEFEIASKKSIRLKYRIYSFFRLLMGLRKNPSNHYIKVFGERWTYGEALAGKMLEGHFESGPQAILQTYIQLQAGFPTIQPLLGVKTLKGIHFQSEKPGIWMLHLIATHVPRLQISTLFCSLFFRMVVPPASSWFQLHSARSQFGLPHQFPNTGTDQHNLAFSWTSPS